MKRIRQTIALFLTLLTVLTLSAGFTVGASAADNYPVIRVSLGGSEILAGRCKLINSVTYVPLRAFAGAMGGGTVSWNGSTGTAAVSTEGLSLTAGVGRLYITANGRCFFTVEEIINLDGSVYVPIRPLARAYGIEVGWSNATRSVTLTNSGMGRCASGSAVYDSDELYWLSRIIYAEAGAEPFLGQIAVGNVILNRVADSRYPDSIYGVIFDKKYGTQFTPAAIGTIYRTPSEQAINAAKICLEGYSLSTEMIFFLNPRIATNFWIVNNCTPVMSIGGHDFYK